MFINISNHPMESWSSDQFETAREEFGTNDLGKAERFVNLGFPVVDPTGDENYLDQLVSIWMERIHELYAKHGEAIRTVYLMGEIGFCARLGEQLRKLDVVVIHSTTWRFKMHQDFVRFRQTY